MNNNRNGNGLLRNSFFYIVVFLGIMGVLYYMFGSRQSMQTQQIQSSQFITELKKNNIKDFTMQPSGSTYKITGTYRHAKKSSGSSGLAGIVPMFANDYTAILISRLVLGAGFGLYNSQAISMISVWYEGTTRAQMLGWRAAAEQIGQACTLAIAGLILSYAGWHASFAVYLLAFVVLFFFAVRVPDDSKAQDNNVAEDDLAEELTEVEEPIKKISPVVYLLVLFAFLLVVDYVGMENRFPGLAVAIKGSSYTGSSMFLSLMLIGATLGGLFYGLINKALGFNTVYLGLGLMAISNFLFAFANGNFAMLVIGLLLIGFPLQLVSPLIFNLLPDLAPAKRQPLVTSMVLIGFNFGAFFSPTIAEWMNRLVGRPMSGLDLAAPFPIYGVMLIVIALIIFFATRHSKQAN